MLFRLSALATLLSFCGCIDILGISGEYTEASDAAATPVFHTEGVNHQSCIQPLSCAGQSCCSNPQVAGGAFLMGSDAGYDESPEHKATVSPFQLDAFEVTVGRFRAFLQDYEKGWRPIDGAGGHPKIGDTGWQIAWEAKLPPSRSSFIENLKCIPFKYTWTDVPADSEQFALNCVNWYEAFAFCIWDGGRLPTEAEWEFASTGGDQNRTYAWGELPPGCDQLRNFCDSEKDPSPFVEVGEKPKGNGRWNHFDLAGSLWEWTFDSYDDTWYGGHGKVCDDCANTTVATRVDRGGSFYESDVESFRTSYRGRDFPENRNDWLGFRCARSSQ
jgi:formylglycine-generating enzyme required for sulfatase activity